jgi:hypothetical protein
MRLPLKLPFESLQAPFWDHQFPAKQACGLASFVEQLDVQEDTLEVRVRTEGLVSLVAELRQQDERKAA